MYGQELAAEIGKRRGGDKPNPGTIYPALKDLSNRGMIVSHLDRSDSGGQCSVYKLTPKGQIGLAKSLEYFRTAFGEIFDSTLASAEGRKKQARESSAGKSIA